MGEFKKMIGENEYKLTYLNENTINLYLNFQDFPEGQSFNFNFKIPKDIVRDVNFTVKAYPRPNRNTQQIFINNVYFMSLPSRVHHEGVNRDSTNKLGEIFIKFIVILYQRGVSLKDIKKVLNETINKNIKRHYVKKEFIEKQQCNLLKNYKSRI